jgi:deoxyadenosine/deoxycytidine kinase
MFESGFFSDDPMLYIAVVQLWILIALFANMRKRTKDRPRPIVVTFQGIIGAGKTTLKAEFDRILTERGIVWTDGAEPIDDVQHTSVVDLDGVEHFVNLFALFCKDPQRYALPFQICMYMKRKAILCRAAVASGGAAVMSAERDLVADRIFADQQIADGNIDLAGKAAYDLVCVEHPAPPTNVHVYLRCSAATALERIAIRGRPGEETISPAYLEALELRHEEAFAGDSSMCVVAAAGAVVIVLDGEKSFETLTTSGWEMPILEAIASVRVST